MCLFSAAEMFQEAHIQFGMLSGALFVMYWLSVGVDKIRSSRAKPPY